MTCTSGKRRRRIAVAWSDHLGELFSRAESVSGKCYSGSIYVRSQPRHLGKSSNTIFCASYDLPIWSQGISAITKKKKRSEPSSAGVKEVALLRIKLCKLLAIWDLGRVLYSSKKIRQKYVERCVLLYYSMSNSSYLHILYLFVLFVLFSALLPFHASSTK